MKTDSQGRRVKAEGLRWAFVETSPARFQVVSSITAGRDEHTEAQAAYEFVADLENGHCGARKAARYLLR